MTVTPTTPIDFQEEFEVIIVGAGHGLVLD